MDLYVFVLRAYIYVFQRAPVSESASYNSRIGKCVQKLFSLRSIFEKTKLQLITILKDVCTLVSLFEYVLSVFVRHRE